MRELEPTVVVATDRAVRLLRVGSDRADVAACADGGDPEPGPDERCALVYEPSDGIPIRDVAVLDVDQDGLDDVVILRENGVELYGHRSADDAATRDDAAILETPAPTDPG